MRDADFLKRFADDFIPEFLIEPLHVLAGVELDGVEFSEVAEVGFDVLHEDVSQALSLPGFGDGDLADFHAAVGLGDEAGAGEDGAGGVCVADAKEPEVGLRWAFEQDFFHGECHAERAAEDFLPEFHSFPKGGAAMLNLGKGMAGEFHGDGFRWNGDAFVMVRAGMFPHTRRAFSLHYGQFAIIS